MRRLLIGRQRFDLGQRGVLIEIIVALIETMRR